MADMFENWLNTPMGEQAMMPVNTGQAQSLLQGSMAATPADMRGYAAPATDILRGPEMAPAPPSQSQQAAAIPIPQTKGPSAEDIVNPASAVKQVQEQKYAAYQKRLAGFERDANNYS